MKSVLNAIGSLDDVDDFGQAFSEHGVLDRRWEI